MQVDFTHRYFTEMDVWYWLKAQGGDGRLAGALSRCSSLSSINTSSGIDVESPSDTASLSAHHLIRRYTHTRFAVPCYTERGGVPVD